MFSPRVVLFMVGALASCVAAPASAQDAGTMSCGTPTSEAPSTVIPVDQAHGVSIDAPVRVEYTAGYFDPATGPGGDPATLIDIRRCPNDGCGVPCRYGDDPMGTFVAGHVQVLGDVLVYEPDNRWEPMQAYTGIARGRDGDLTFSFCTGTLPDTTPPMLGPLQRVDSMPVPPRCDAPEGGYRIETFFAPATDGDGPPGSIEYLLFQTRGAGIREPVLRRTLNNFATDMLTMAFVLPPSQATDIICVRVIAVDGTGNQDPSDEDASVDCIDPLKGSYFASLCSVSAPGARRAPPVGLAALGVLAVVVAARRRRPPR